MPEIKHAFNQGKMNKDFDERLVENGQYRDANNIQVSTSEADDIGTVQSLLGNSALPIASATTISTSGVCVGAITDESNNAAYWLVANSNDWSNSAPSSILTYKDVIYKSVYSGTSNTHTVTPVFIDFWLEKHPTPSDWVSGSFSGTSKDLGGTATANLSIGMYVKFVGSTSSTWRKITNISGTTITWDSNYAFAGGFGPSWLEFSWQIPESYGVFAYANNQFKNRVLRFDKNKLITGLNIIDDLLFWTDNNTEPKKINLTRALAGTDASSLNKSTKLIVNDVDTGYYQEKDITVIKQNPQTSPVIDLNVLARSGVISTSTSFNFNDTSAGDEIEITTNAAANYKSNDTILFGSGINPSPIEFHVRARVKTINSNTITLSVLNKESTNPSSLQTYNIVLEDIAKNLFEEKFIRVAVRWKYVDGEYSTISPFSDVAFSPGDFKYETIEGYNTGMVNQTKELVIKDFIPLNLPKEVVQIDILYKESNSPVIYTIDSISSSDIAINGGTNAWNTVNNSLNFQGKYAITSENIYAAIPSNQILRHWDAVPRKALAQSVTGSRVVYGNYLQNYNLKDDFGDKIKPQIDALVDYRRFESTEMLKNPLVTPDNANTGNEVDGWTFDSSWGLVDYYGYWFLGGGFEESNASNGVTQFHKIHQNLTFENNETYRIKLKVENYIQGTVRLSLIGSAYYAIKDINSNGEYDFTLKIESLNTNSFNSLYASGKTFNIQSLSSTNNWKGQISNFSCKQVFEPNKKSIKSQRNYQLGVVYADEFGRQTPVLTDETAALKVPKSDSVNQNSIKVKLQNNIPGFAHSFKFFIKETSSEYYNIAMDRIYKSLDDNVWLSFPSSERNKIDEETYLVLKKQIEGPAVIEESATYKVLAIENEAPNFIRLSRNTLGSGSGLNSSGGINTLFGDTNYRPADDQKVLAIKKDIWLNNDDGAPLEDVSKLVLQFKDGVNVTKYYTVDLLSTKEINGVDYYVFHLNKPIDDYDASWIMNGNNLNTDVVLIVAEEKDELKPEFEGRFFVKLLLDDNLRDFVLSQALLAEDNVGIVSRAEAWYASDDGAVGDGFGTATRYQKTAENILVNTTINNIAPFNGSDDFDNSGDSSYSPARGTLYQNSTTQYLFRMSEEAVLKWNRILKFKLYGSWQISPLQDDNNSTRKNFFIDRVSYIGKQPLDKNSPADGEYRAPGYWNHQANSAHIPSFNVEYHARYGRGIFQADGTEKKFDNFTPDTWFTSGNYYMELSYSKIWSSSNIKDIDKNDIDTASSWNDAWAVGSPNNSNHDSEQEFVKKLKVGSSFRFSGDVNEKTYTIKKIRKERRWNHTAYPEFVDASGNTFIIAKDANGTIFRIGDGTPDISGSLFAVSEKIDTSTREIETDPVTPSVIYISESLKIEKANFGLATNRRLTWTMEIEEAPGFGTNYDPLNKTASASSTLMDEDTPQFIEFVEPSLDDKNQLTSSDPAIFETQPKTDIDLDIYYEASDFISVGNHDVFHELPWFNCYSFGNGVESNRIKDDFNQVVVDKNPRASTTLQGDYEEEQRKYGLIYSGIYNSTSGVNNTNQFIAAEKITKDVNPEYGSIQKLHSKSDRSGDLLTLCEDRVLAIQANKDALFNADGNINVTASSNVLGQTIPYAGNYGISKNPESFVSQNYRSYFSDKQRGSVIRLSMDGLTPISDAGMSDFFKDNLKSSTSILGTYDNSKKEYNITLKGSSNYTLSYKENVKGWTSFKSFIPEQGVSVANNYYTFAKEGSNSKIWWHHKNTTYNNFYGTQYFSDVTLIFNQQPSIIKTFKTISYEGTQAKVDANTNTSEGEYYNLTAKTGWHVESISTDKQSGIVNEFIEKEGKWFNFIKGDTTSLSNLDTGEFSVQGLGTISSHTTAN